MDKQHMKFLALNVDFDGLSLDFLGSRKPALRTSKSGTPVKVFTVVGQSFVKTVADGHGHAACVNKHYSVWHKKVPP